MVLIANNHVSCNHIIIQSFHHHEDASLALMALLYVILDLSGFSAAPAHIKLVAIIIIIQTLIFLQSASADLHAI